LRFLESPTLLTSRAARDLVEYITGGSFDEGVYQNSTMKRYCHNLGVDELLKHGFVLGSYSRSSADFDNMMAAQDPDAEDEQRKSQNDYILRFTKPSEFSDVRRLSNTTSMQNIRTVHQNVVTELIYQTGYKPSSVESFINSSFALPLIKGLYPELRDGFTFEELVREIHYDPGLDAASASASTLSTASLEAHLRHSLLMISGRLSELQVGEKTTPTSNEINLMIGQLRDHISSFYMAMNLYDGLILSKSTLNGDQTAIANAVKRLLDIVQASSSFSPTVALQTTPENIARASLRICMLVLAQLSLTFLVHMYYAYNDIEDEIRNDVAATFEYEH